MQQSFTFLLALALVASCSDSGLGNAGGQELRTSSAAVFVAAENAPQTSPSTDRQGAPVDPRTHAGQYRSPLKPGPFAVGSKTIFIRDESRPFDPWNAVYGSDAYKQLLGTLDTLGEPRSLVADVWYPAKRPNCHRRECSSEGVKRATYLDYYLGDREIFDRRGVAPFLLTDTGETVEQLRLSDPEGHAQLVSEVLNKLSARKRKSFIGVPVRRGSFPLIVLSHGGFTGEQGNNSHREVWTSEAENLASHGYIVVAMNHTGDSRHPVVFHDPNSLFAQTATPAEVEAAYDVLFTEPGIPDKIFQILFDPANGADAMNLMMARLFQMRVDDVASVIDHMTELDQQSSFLSGRIDLGRIGLAGFSLGSITTQAALGSLDQIDTGMSWNNGMPHAWEPASFNGLTKPHLFSLGSEDELTRNFFSLLPFFMYPSSVPGGVPEDILKLEGERFFPPDQTTPEPVVRSAFERAAGAKLLLEFVDMRHWDVTDAEDFLFPIRRLNRGKARVGFNNVQPHLPFGPEVLDPNFAGELFPILGWERRHRNRKVYFPHKIRSYYSVAWFGLHLRGIERYRQDLTHDPFEARTRSSIQSL